MTSWRQPLNHDEQVIPPNVKKQEWIFPSADYETDSSIHDD